MRSWTANSPSNDPHDARPPFTSQPKHVPVRMKQNQEWICEACPKRSRKDTWIPRRGLAELDPRVRLKSPDGFPTRIRSVTQQSPEGSMAPGRGAQGRTRPREIPLQQMSFGALLEAMVLFQRTLCGWIAPRRTSEEFQTPRKGVAFFVMLKSSDRDSPCPR